MSNKITLSLLGNPNCGKAAIFNLLSGLNQKVSNYPGITVEKKITQFTIEGEVELQLEDFPGAYSMIPQSLDEQIVSDTMLDWIRDSKNRPDGIIYVADMTNLRRNLFGDCFWILLLSSLLIAVILDILLIF